VDDLTFFNTVLPSQGLRVAAIPHENRGFRHSWGPDNAWLVKKTHDLDALPNAHVYYGCSSFQPGPHHLGKYHRRQEYVLLVRSFWVDLDVGKSLPNKPPKYATQREAADAIVAFAANTGLPTPMLVSSGGGVHAYWPMDRDMTVAEWKPLAQALKRALTAAGVLFDPTRTADEASVLRPPGTTNRKGKDRAVTVVLDRGQTSFDNMAAKLAPMVQAAAVSSASPILPGKLSAQNSALGGGMGPDPSSALMIADNCAVIGMMRDTRGLVDQPTWYHSLGVLVHTVEAPEICHEWSKGDDRYTAAETDEKLAQVANHGATTCAKLSEYQSEACAACPFWGKIKSPVQLGRPRQSDPGEAEAKEITSKLFGGGATAGGDVQSDDMPNGFGQRVEHGHPVLTHFVPADGDKPKRWDVFCETFFRPLFNYEVDGAHFNDWVALGRDGKERTFTMEGGTIGAGGAPLAKALGERGIMIIPGKGRVMDSYMNRWMAHLTRTTALVKAYSSFGWAGDVFVTGGVVVNPDGADTPAVMAGVAKQRKDAVTLKGDLETWVQLVDKAYNAPGQEAFQFQLACGFAAPLLSLMDQVRGVTVYAHSAGSGVGKSTVQKVALSAWGDPDMMMLAQNKVTHNALWGLLGAYNSLPIVYDELTNVKNDEVSELVFSMSSGRAKERLRNTGQLQDNNSNWSTILMASGNTLLSEKLAAHRDNASAEMSRLFEFTLNADPHLSVVDANDLFPQFDRHYGHAGLAFARYIVANKAKVTDYLRKVQKQVVAEFQMEQVDRHWSALFASVLVALYVCRALRLVAFEVAPIKAWMHDRLAENRNQKTALVLSDEEKLDQMLRDLWPDVLVTVGRGTRNSPSQPVIDKPLNRGTIIGRGIIADASGPEELWISRPSIREWAAKRSVNYNDLLQGAVNLGWAFPRDDHRFNLGVGTVGLVTGTHVMCWRFRPDQMPAAVATLTTPGSNVVSLNHGLTGGKP